jgi:hypothetical protein
MISTLSDILFDIYKQVMYYYAPLSKIWGQIFFWSVCRSVNEKLLTLTKLCEWAVSDR